LAFLSFLKDVSNPSEEQIPFFFVKSIVNKNFPKNLQLGRIEEMFRTLDDKDSEKVHSFQHLFVKAVTIKLISNHRV